VGHGVVEGAKEWATIEIVKQAVIRLVTMLNPAGAIVQAILAIFNTIMFFMNNWDQVTAFVSSIFDSVSSIASGAIGAASKFVEKSMAMAIPLILDFMAQMLNLGGIADRIQKIIERVRKPIDQILDKIIAWISKKVKKLFGKDTKDKKDDKNPHKGGLGDTEVGKDINFYAAGKSHHLWIDTKGSIKVMVASSPTNIPFLLERWAGLVPRRFKDDPEKFANANGLISSAKQKHQTTLSDAKLADAEITAAKKKKAEASEKESPADKKTETDEELLMQDIKQLFEIFGEDENEQKIDPAIVVTPKFNCKDTLDETEFRNQLLDQQEGINDMTVNTWLTNRQTFLDRYQDQKARGLKNPQGRDPEGDQKARQIRTRLLNEYKLKLLRENPSLDNNEVELNRLVEEYGKSKAVVHKVDQIAGGSGTDLIETELGDARVDYSLGAQWGKQQRAVMLDASVKSRVKEENRDSTKMFVILSYEKTVTKKKIK
jgi:hypothetical protein